MDKLSDFIPLLIIIGSVIVSIVQSSKKKKADQDMKKTMLPKGVPMDRPMDRPTSRPMGAPTVNLPKMKSVTVTPQKTVQEKKNEIMPAQTIFDPAIFNPEVNRSVSTVTDSPIFNEPTAVTAGFMFDAINTDELKKAVIYSEILQRKEY